MRHQAVKIAFGTHDKGKLGWAKDRQQIESRIVKQIKIKLPPASVVNFDMGVRGIKKTLP